MSSMAEFKTITRDEKTWLMDGIVPVLSILRIFVAKLALLGLPSLGRSHCKKPELKIKSNLQFP